MISGILDVCLIVNRAFLLVSSTQKSWTKFGQPLQYRGAKMCLFECSGSIKVTA